MTHLGLSYTSDPAGPVFAAVTQAPGRAEAARVVGRYASADAARAAHPGAEVVEVHPAGQAGLTDLEVLDRSIPRGVVVVDVVEKTVSSYRADGSLAVRPFSRAALSDATITAPLHFTVCLVHPDKEALTDEFVVLGQDFNIALVARSSIAAWALDIHGIPTERTLASYGAASAQRRAAGRRTGFLGKLFGR